MEPLIRFECVVPAFGSWESKLPLFWGLSPLRLKRFAATTEFDDELVQRCFMAEGPVSNQLLFFLFIVCLCWQRHPGPLDVRIKDQAPMEQLGTKHWADAKLKLTSWRPAIAAPPQLRFRPLWDDTNLRGELVGPLFHDNAPSENLLCGCVGILILICDRYSKPMQTRTYRYGPESRGSV